MREMMDQWHFVVAAYAVGILGTLIMVVWSWLSMVRAEARRERIRRK